MALTALRQDWRKILFDPLAWQLSRRELRRLIVQAGTNLEAIIDATETYVGRGFYDSIHAVQKRAEIIGLTERVRGLDPQVIVEIGTFKGGTLFIFCRASRPRLVISIDLPGGNYGGGYDRRRARLHREFLYDRPGVAMHSLRLDSHAPATAVALDNLLAGRPIDFLYIDGDHSLDGVRADFETYGARVRPGGLIALHDIATHRDDHEVWRLWPELQQRFATESLVVNPRGPMGIGIVEVGSKPLIPEWHPNELEVKTSTS